ncbi:ExbD/TolR family protein [Agarilytica rhodophyticola]|uniref:ExbD/TolR family protein n=1 Tax=Agarilytica rhodophyticola TaxID=1737490 RepID=UPI000B341270|nr:biopolymer transporter ExbD [Agarilytica rhodophyticola]
MKRRMKSLSVFDDKPEVDMTPMLDVVFIMLIFFIVAASFSTEKTIAINQPPKAPEEAIQEQKSNLLIHIDSTNHIKIDNRSIDARAVRAMVAQHLAANPDSQIIVRAHEMAATKSYIVIADQVRQVTQGRLMLTTYSN